MAIALYFAILKVHPTPFCIMDEIEAALDEANVVRTARYMRTLADKTQFIVITHRRGHHGGRRRAVRRHHAGTGRQQDLDHQSERYGEGIEDSIVL